MKNIFLFEVFKELIDIREQLIDTRNKLNVFVSLDDSDVINSSLVILNSSISRCTSLIKRMDAYLCSRF